MATSRAVPEVGFDPVTEGDVTRCLLVFAFRRRVLAGNPPQSRKPLGGVVKCRLGWTVLCQGTDNSYVMPS